MCITQTTLFTWGCISPITVARRSCLQYRQARVRPAPCDRNILYSVLLSHYFSMSALSGQTTYQSIYYGDNRFGAFTVRGCSARSTLNNELWTSRCPL